jgi:hypothetical protein
MPSRLMIAVILASWLAMTGLIIHHEVVPMMLADASPTYQPDLTDEIGAPYINWVVKKNGKRAGSANSRIVPGSDRSFELHESWRFDTAVIQSPPVEMRLRVNENRKLKAVYMKLMVANINVEIRGEVVGNTLTPRLLLNGVEDNTFTPGKIDVNDHVDPINAMSLINRLRGLHEKQTWTVRPFDLSRCVNLPFVKSMSGPTSLSAVVKSDTLTWDHKEVACFKIEYREPGKEITARTWVRKADGLVLQQESSRHGAELVLERIP